MNGMPLEEYRKKRDFSKTPEPAAQTRRSRSRRIFVVQKHRASRLHYDFRLEINGVLVSWAVPKGPSLNPRDKRLAIMTEDHPLEYAQFEGIIPDGQYGAGTVMVWDIGSYDVSDGSSAEQQLARGEIKVVLRGRKLRGGFVLIRIGKRLVDPAQKLRWLLIKERDEYADASWRIENAESNRSALTGCTLEEIEEARSAKAHKRPYSTGRSLATLGWQGISCSARAFAQFRLFWYSQRCFTPISMLTI
jgi:bifunctional non-homologous end joining protein LigD